MCLSCIRSLCASLTLNYELLETTYRSCSFRFQSLFHKIGKLLCIQFPRFTANIYMSIIRSALLIGQILLSILVSPVQLKRTHFMRNKSSSKGNLLWQNQPQNWVTTDSSSNIITALTMSCKQNWAWCKMRIYLWAMR